MGSYSNMCHFKLTHLVGMINSALDCSVKMVFQHFIIKCKLYGDAISNPWGSHEIKMSVYFKYSYK